MKLDLRGIPAAYINLKHHVEKNETMRSILVECGFKTIIRVEGVFMPLNPVGGCSAAHHKALSEIKPPFVLFEDDCMIKNFRHEIEVPDDADAVYLGISSWGRMNGHSGPYVQYQKVAGDLYRVYNMLSGHSVLYLSEEYTRLCQRIARHAAYLIGDYQDIGFAEIQRWFNVYAFNDPLFFQTSSRDATINPLLSYATEECMSYNKDFFLPVKII